MEGQAAHGRGSDRKKCLFFEFGKSTSRTDSDDCCSILNQSQRYIGLSNYVERTRGAGSKVRHRQGACICSLNRTI